MNLPKAKGLTPLKCQGRLSWVYLNARKPFGGKVSTPDPAAAGRA